MARFRVQWYETSSVPGNFGWAHGRQAFVDDLGQAFLHATAPMLARETNVTIDLLKEPGPGAIQIGERKRNQAVFWTKRGRKMADEAGLTQEAAK